MTIFFFAQWYPQKYDAMAGLFIRKHAESVAMQGNTVHVFHVFQHVDQKEKEYVVNDDRSGVIEHITYLPSGVGILSEIKCYIRSAQSLINSGIKPDVMHINVLSTKIALTACYLNKKYRIPYVITEHWSGYLKVNGTFASRKYQGRVLQYVAKRAKCIMPVSRLLLEAMKECGITNNNWQIVPNVVDDFFFAERQVRTDNGSKKRILHVSCFDDKPKNTTGIIKAIAELSKLRTDFELTMVGVGPDWHLTTDLASQYELIENGIVNFIGEQRPLQVKQWFDKSDIFLLFSNYEIAPVVISEALVSGVPIVSSSVGFMPEVITPDVGKLVEPNHISQLVDVLNYMLDNYQDYEYNTIRSKGEIYSYTNVGAQYQTIYREAIK